MKKLITYLINSNIYISLAAVALTIATQIQFGLKPAQHPYLFIIFFATLFEYNLHRLITIIKNKEALNSPKHKWVQDNLFGFYLLVAFSVIGFLVVCFLADTKVLLALAPLAAITIFYSIPIYISKSKVIRFREIPYLKIFLIAIVWSGSTILLPVIKSGQSFAQSHLWTMLIERFLFIFAITIPFDIRDKEIDSISQLKTIPQLISDKKAIWIANLALLLFTLLSIIHYFASWEIVTPLIISSATTAFFLTSQKFKSLDYYHYGILDGTILLQGALVILFSLLK